MMQFGMVSYLAAALFYTIFSILLSTNWRGRQQLAFLLTASLASLVWALAGAFAGQVDWLALKHFLSLEILRNLAWMAFLWRCLSLTQEHPKGSWRSPALLTVVGFSLLTLVAELSPTVNGLLPSIGAADFRIVSHCLQALIGLILVEQLYRNTRVEMRWGIKFMCIGLMVMFAYDFVLYTEAILFNRIDQNLWAARGLINAMALPLLAISVSRNPEWSRDMFVSRTVIFHATALMATGVYLLVIAFVGYYVEVVGGSWGKLVQILVVVGGLIILFILLFSGRIRASVKVFFNRHFFTYKYDYRKEWLGLSLRLAEHAQIQRVRENSILALTDIAESAGGALWEKQENGTYQITAEHSFRSEGVSSVTVDDSLVSFLARTQWVVEVPEYLQSPELYEGLNLQPWCAAVKDLWLVVPLMQKGELHGFICLVEPLAPRDINWEDHDLLKTVGQQLANYLSLLEVSEALADARQFEAFNRLSAFVVHDLNNLVAQVNLILENAEKHKTNPAFVDDMLETLESAVGKMNRMLSQLRQGEVGGVEQGQNQEVAISEVIQEAVTQQQGMFPQPVYESNELDLSLNLDAHQLTAVLGHLIRNAQDATTNDGHIAVRLYKTDNQAIIEVQDTGSGMDADFIRDRLFKPFDTTKGNAGMGIGVFEARQFMHKIGGALDVESELGKGSVFRLSFPSE